MISAELLTLQPSNYSVLSTGSQESEVSNTESSGGSSRNYESDDYVA